MQLFVNSIILLLVWGAVWGAVGVAVFLVSCDLVGIPDVQDEIRNQKAKLPLYIFALLSGPFVWFIVSQNSLSKIWDRVAPFLKNFLVKE